MTNTLVRPEIVSVPVEEFPAVVMQQVADHSRSNVTNRDGFHLETDMVDVWGYFSDIRKHNSNKVIVQEARVYELSPSGDPLGMGIASKDMRVPEGRYDAYPYVGCTRTEIHYRGKGLAVDRLRILNRLALDSYGVPLHSSHVSTAENARRVWEKLTESGEAEQYTEYNTEREQYFPRWRFLSTLID